MRGTPCHSSYVRDRSVKERAFCQALLCWSSGHYPRASVRLGSTHIEGDSAPKSEGVSILTHYSSDGLPNRMSSATYLLSMRYKRLRTRLEHSVEFLRIGQRPRSGGSQAPLRVKARSRSGQRYACACKLLIKKGGL